MAEIFFTGTPITSGPVPDAPTFGEVSSASLQRTYDPIISAIERNFRFSFAKDKNYNYKNYAKGQYIDYAEEFAALQNDMAAIHLRDQIDRSNASRQTLSQATLGKSIGAGFLDPANYLGITFGGPALTLGRAALKTAASVGVVESMREGLIQATDPTAPFMESATNVVSSMMFGAAIGAGTAAPSINRGLAFQRAQQVFTDFYAIQKANENAVNITPEMFATRAPKEQRQFGALDTVDIEKQLSTRVYEATVLRAQAEAPDAPQQLRDQAVEVDRSATELRNELGIRHIEDSGFNVDDPYGIPANWLTDSVFYKAITTPMKRALQSNAPTTVKKMFVDLAYDMGQFLNQHTFGVATDPSVFLRTATSHGQMVKLETQLKGLYGEVQQNPLSFDDWISSVSTKRVLGDQNLSEVELKAASVIEDQFGGDVTVNLEDLGLIATARGRESKIRIINQEIDFLTTRRIDATDREIDLIDARIEELKKDADMVVRIAINDPVKKAEYESVMVDITAWNKKWMAGTIDRLGNRVAEDRPIFDKLDATYKSRGLSKKQEKFYNDLKTRIADAEKTIAEFQDLTAKLEAAKSVDDLIALKDNLDVTPKMAEAMDKLSDGIEALGRRIDGAKAAIDAANVEPKAEPFFPIFYKHDKIRANREAFIKILMREFEKNPYVYDFNMETGDYVRIKLGTDPVELRKRAESTTNKILSEGDPVESGDVVAGLGRSKHFRHRNLDIPRSAIIDYIETNPVSVLTSYNGRVRPRALFQEKFGKDYNGVRTEMELEMIRAGKSEAEINAMRRDFDSLYRRVVSNVLDNPDAINQKIAYGLRFMSGLTFMGGAALSSIPDFGRIVMQYELAPMMKGVQSMIDMDTLRRSGLETQLSGSALEYALGMYRLESQVSNNFVAPKLLNSAQHMFYIANGLTPLTIAYKKLSGLVMGHTLIDYSIRLADGTISQSDRVFVAMHGIDEALARRIAKAPWQRNKEGLILPNTEQWADHIEIPEIEGKRITVIEAMEDGSSVSKTNSKGEVIPAYYNRKTNTIYFDRGFIEGPMFQRKGWLKPRTVGVNPLPDIFKTPKQWANFVMLHEVNRSRFSAEDLNLEIPKPADGFTRIYRFAVKDQQRAKVADWVAESETYQNMLKASGRWFSDSLEEAKWYAKENPEGELLYTDVPTKDVEAYRVSNIVQTKDGLNPQAFSARAEKELFVPRDVADASKLFSTLENVAYENKINELAMADYKAAQKISVDDVERFRVGLNSGITNTVIHGSPADRPIITDGVVHLPMSIAGKFGFKEHPVLKGYARIENGFLGLPFQFYNFLFGTMNKTAAAMAHGQVKNRAIGAATMLGLAYMVLKAKTPEGTWDRMSFQDKMARSVDASGLLPFYSDLFYRTMHSTIALGGPNITGGFLQPKFKQRESVLDVVTDLAGAGPSWAANVGEGLFKVVSGDYGNGTADLLRSLPFSTMWFFKGEVSELAQALRG